MTPNSIGQSCLTLWKFAGISILAALLVIMSLVSWAFAKNEATASVAGQSIPGVIGKTPIGFWYEYYAEEPSPTGQSLLGPVQRPGVLAAANQDHFGKYYFPTPSANGWAETYWGFTAVPDPKIAGNVVLGDLLPLAPPYKHATDAIVQTPKPDYGLALAWNKSWITIGAAVVGKAGKTEAFAETGLNILGCGLVAHLLAKARAEIHDDVVSSRTTWNMAADSYDTFTIFDSSITLTANGVGSWVSIDESGITLGNQDSSVEANLFAINHIKFQGTAALDNGGFSTTGGFNGLSWQLSYDPLDPTFITQAFLSSDSFPKGPITFVGADVGEDAFWNSNPRFEMTMSWAMAGEAAAAPEPSSLYMFAMGLVWLTAIVRVRRRRYSDR